MINVRRDVQDPFYRYKMPRILSKIEGKGNGIKTVIPNLVDVGKAIGRPASYVTKFFGAELGALSTCDERAAKYIVNGVHDAEKLQQLLDVFIAKFVLCASCENPETFLSVSKKDGSVLRSCQACGHRGPVDMMHKLVSYIRANPPPKPVKQTQARDRANDGAELAAASSAAIQNENSESVPGIEDRILVDDASIDVERALEKRENIDRDEDWAEEDAARMRESELSSLSEAVLKKLSVVESSKGLEKNLEVFGDLLESQKDSISNDEIVKVAEDRGIEKCFAVVACVQVLLNRSRAAEVLLTLKKRSFLFSLLVNGSDEGAKYLLGSIDRLLTVGAPHLLETESKACVPAILQTLYDQDVVSETQLLSWYEKSSKRFVSRADGVRVRQAAAPFFEWLANADSEEDDDSE